MYRQGSTERNLGRRACVDDAQPVLARVELDEGPPKDRVGEGDLQLARSSGEASRDFRLRIQPFLGSDEPGTEDRADLRDRPGRV